VLNHLKNIKMKTSISILIVLSVMSLGAINPVSEPGKSLPPKEFQLKLDIYVRIYRAQLTSI
jgi:hypothetical protein